MSGQDAGKAPGSVKTMVWLQTSRRWQLCHWNSFGKFGKIMKDLVPDFGPKTGSYCRVQKLGLACLGFSVCVYCFLSFSVFLCLSLSFSVFLCLCFTGRVHCKPKNPIDARLCFSSFHLCALCPRDATPASLPSMCGISGSYRCDLEGS